MILNPTVGEEFSGSTLPLGWSSQTWESQGGGAGGSATVAGGRLAVDGAFAEHGRDLRRRAARSSSLATFGAVPLPARRLHGQLRERLGDVQHLQHDRTRSSPAPTSARGHRQRRDPRLAGRLSAPLPDRLERNQREVLRRRRARATRQGPSGRRCARPQATSRAAGRAISVDWARVEPIPGLRHVRLAGVRRRAADQLGRALVDGRHARPGPVLRSASAPATHPTPDGSWSAFTPMPPRAATSPGKLALRPVPSRADDGRPDRTPALRGRAASPCSDTSAPTVTIDSVSKDLLGSGESTELTFHASENGSFTVRRDGNSARRAPSSPPAATPRAPARAPSRSPPRARRGSERDPRLPHRRGHQHGLRDDHVDPGHDRAPTVLIDAVSDPLLGQGESSTELTWHATEGGPYSVRWAAATAPPAMSSTPAPIGRAGSDHHDRAGRRTRRGREHDPRLRR